ncbi:hypothetical protein L6452_23473 [Arctium lappa]|uniref:Uncharacterized protein n=1 Tax=Arctium lappa TaxID=4217 RepID=A0ACB9B173_ARCLA|nr:hypothetical protein L6452_23473 [Arctium lappa]
MGRPIVDLYASCLGSLCNVANVWLPPRNWWREMLVYAIWHYVIAYIEVCHMLWRDERQIDCIFGLQSWKLRICENLGDWENRYVVTMAKGQIVILSYSDIFCGVWSSKSAHYLVWEVHLFHNMLMVRPCVTIAGIRWIMDSSGTVGSGIILPSSGC